MKIERSAEANAVYIQVRDGQIDHTVEISADDDVWADVDAAGNVLGIEILLSTVDFELEIPERIPERIAR